ncbi:hypothetical protein BC828DRAFT_391095 [Blastocladiella britannica]|nr:hypothetical protein BC828DRAFT_391095 [Blastocladiella britannica]
METDPIAYDEREELLREAAALGNVKAVTHYLQAGVAASARNKVNGQTPLHWASVRGHAAVITVLLRYGADTSITNAKGLTPRQVAKSDAVRALFPSKGSRSSSPVAADADKENTLPGSTSTGDQDASLVPNYMRNPDLLKTWTSPEELPPGAQPTVLRESDRPPASPVLSATTSVAVPSPAPATTVASSSESIEILVATMDDRPRLLGTARVPANASVTSLVAKIERELISPAVRVGELGRGLGPNHRMHATAAMVVMAAATAAVVRRGRSSSSSASVAGGDPASSTGLIRLPVPSRQWDGESVKDMYGAGEVAVVTVVLAMPPTSSSFAAASAVAP